MTDGDTIQNALRSLVDAFNNHDLDCITDFLDEDCVLEICRDPKPFGSHSVGHEAVRKGLAPRFEGLPDAGYSDDSHFVDDDSGMSHWTLTGTRLSGERIEVPGCEF